MKLKSLFAFVVAIGVAGTLTWTTMSWDQQRGLRHQASEALAWARQVATQAEGLAMHARGSGEADPVGWAISFLSQGIEPRIMQVSKYSGSADQPEVYTFDEKEGVFEYSKVSTPENGAGVSVRILSPYRGFLDARSKLTSDLAITAFFGTAWFVTFMLLFPLWRSRGGRTVRIQDPTVNERIARWAAESRGVLTELGGNVRDMVKDAHNLAMAAMKSRDTLLGVHDRVHGRIRDLHTSRQALKQAHELLAKAGADGADARELLTQVAEMLRTSEYDLRQCEIDLEPLATDLDVAFHSYDQVFHATESMNRSISKTKGSVVIQARMMRQLLEGEDAGPRMAPPPAEPELKVANG